MPTHAQYHLWTQSGHRRKAVGSHARRTLVCWVVWVFWITPALGHGLTRAVSTGEAVIVQLTLEDGTPFSGERFEIYPPGLDTRFQLGFTDQQGRVAFVPDRAGAWRVKVSSKTGHGVDFQLDTERLAVVQASQRSRLRQAFDGVSILMFVFGVLSLILGQRRFSSRPGGGPPTGGTISS